MYAARLARRSGQPGNRYLTVKLRGRAEAPDGAEGAQSLSARGGKRITDPPTMVIQRPMQAFALRRDLIVSAAQELYETEPVTEWVRHYCNTAPLIGADVTFQTRTSSASPSHCRRDIRHHEIQMDG